MKRINTTNSPNILFFRRNLTVEGGAERLMLEVASRFDGDFLNIHVAGLKVNPKIFDGAYKHLNIKSLFAKYPESVIGKILISIRGIYKLRKFVKKEKVNIIIGQSPEDAEIIYLANLFLSSNYSIFIHGSKFWFPLEMTKYSSVFNGVFEEIRNSVIGHRKFIPKKRPKMSIFGRIIIFIRSLLDYTAVKNADKIFVLSKQVAWEVEKLYGIKPIVNKGGIDKRLFSYKPKKDIRKKLNIDNDKKIILSVNRLDPQKRTTLSIKTFREILKYDNKLHLIIVGEGSEKKKIIELMNEFKLNDSITVAGYVKEEELLDYYSYADVFIHPGWLDFDITVLEALSFNNKVVCSREFELDENLKEIENKFIFRAEPTKKDVLKKLKETLNVSVKKINKEIISKYTWDNYTKRLINHLK